MGVAAFMRHLDENERHELQAGRDCMPEVAHACTPAASAVSPPKERAHSGACSAERQPPGVVMLTGMPACGKRVRMTQERPCRHAKRGSASGQDDLRTHSGRKMKAFAELRAMLEVWSTPPGLGRRVYKRFSSRCVGFDAEVPISGKIVPRTRLGWVPGGIPSAVKAGIDRT